MNTALVTTGWTGSGGIADVYRPSVLDDYPPVYHDPVLDGDGIIVSPGYWTGITRCEQQDRLNPENPFTVLVECDDATLAAIQADPAYGPSVVVLTPDDSSPA